MEKKEKLYLPQEPCWEESIQLIKNSIRFKSYDSFRKVQIDTLPQNSYKTRIRYFSYIAKRFFPDKSLKQLVTDVWRYYRNDELLKNIMRCQFLKSERLVSKFVIDILSNFVPGTTFKKNIFENFIYKQYDKPKPKAVSRLSNIIIKMGYCSRKGNIYTVLNNPKPNLACIILIHFIFAPQPKTITINEIIIEPFWKYLNINSEYNIRMILKEAAMNGLISKYIKADQLEQITTKYSLDEFIQKRIK